MPSQRKSMGKAADEAVNRQPSTPRIKLDIFPIASARLVPQHYLTLGIEQKRSRCPNVTTKSTKRSFQTLSSLTVSPAVWDALGALEREAAQAENSLKINELASYFLPFFLAPLLQLNLGRLRSGSLFALVSQR